MSIKTNFLNGGSYLPQDLVNSQASLLTDGVYGVSSEVFLVSANSPADLSVNVAAGASNLKGLYTKSDSIVNVLIAANTSGYNRIDTIVIEIDTSLGTTTLKAIQGIPSSSPVASTLSSTQLELAQILVGNNVSVLNTNIITDKRVNVDLFGSQLANRADKLQQDYIIPTFANGWVNYSAGFNTAKYYKDNFGIVHLEGMVKSGTIATNIFAMPAGYRPLASAYYGCTSGGAFGTIKVDVAGGVVLAAGSNNYCCLEGITFKSIN